MKTASLTGTGSALRCVILVAWSDIRGNRAHLLFSRLSNGIFRAPSPQGNTLHGGQKIQ